MTEYFNDRNSNVFIASLDATKAFDRVNHRKLFSTLIAKNVPLAFLNVIMNWYCKLCMFVRWNGARSSVIHVMNGVRQGGVLSPSVFLTYILTMLRVICCILYADDILLISASIVMLQSMLSVCISVCESLDVLFNHNNHSALPLPRLPFRLCLA